MNIRYPKLLRGHCGHRTPRYHVRRKVRVEMLEARQMLAADPASWMLPTGEDHRGHLQVVDNGDVYWASGNSDADLGVVVKKYASGGIEQWTTTFPSTGSEIVSATAIDRTDPMNPVLYVRGSFNDQLDFGTAGILQSNGDWDDFVAKLDADGTPIWAKSFGGSGSEFLGGVAVHGASVYLNGNFDSSVTFGNSTLHSTGSSRDSYVLKLDAASGDVQWVKQISGHGSSRADEITAHGDSNGSVNLYVSGSFSGGPIEFDNFTLQENGRETYIAKLDGSGASANFVWVEQFGSPSSSIYSQRTDANGRIFVSGNFQGTAYFGSEALVPPDDYDGFVMRVTDNGATANIDWVNQFGGTPYIALDDGTLFVATHFTEDQNEFNSTDGSTVSLTPRGYRDAAIVRYNVDGQLREVQRMGGSEHANNQDLSSNPVAYSGIVYMNVRFETSGSDAPAQTPNSTFPNAFPKSTNDRERLLLKLNTAAPIVRTLDSELIGSDGTPVTLTATAVAGELATDLSDSIVWTDQSGATLGYGASIDAAFGIGIHKITSSVIDPVSGLIGMGGTVVTVADPNQPVVIFEDSFENGQWNGVWVEDSQNDWFTSAQRSTDGNSSAEVDGRATGATLSIATPIDMTAYTNAELSFDWYIEGGVDDGEGLKLEFFNGSTWDEILSLDGNVDQENTWHDELVQLDPQYLISDFQFRYSATMNRSNEDANIDNVQLIATSFGPPNQLPSITSTEVVNATQDMMYSYDVDATDPDAGDTLTYSLDVAPIGMMIDSSTGFIDWTPGSSQVGDNDVTVRVQDQRGGSDAQSFVINVTNVNDPPSIATLPFTSGIEGVAYSYDVNANDPDPGDTLTYSLDVMPAGMAIDTNTGVIDWTPGSEDVGAANTVTVRVTDLLGEADTQTFSIDVSAQSNVDAIYIYDIRFDSKRGNKDWRAVFEIRSDSNGNGMGDVGDNPIAGVQVEVTFAGNIYTGVTDSSGVFRTSWIKDLSTGNHYANAVDLALNGYQWNPLALDLEDDSDEIFGPDDLLMR